MSNTNSPVKTAGEPQASDVCAEDALDELRHNRTHTVPPGMRGVWVSTKLPRLSEEHLSATDENAVPPPVARPQNKLRTSHLLVLGALLGGAVVGLLLFRFGILAPKAPPPATPPLEKPDNTVVSPVEPVPVQAPAVKVAPEPAAPAISAKSAPVSEPAPKPRSKVVREAKQPVTPKAAPAQTRETLDPNGNDELIFKSR